VTTDLALLSVLAAAVALLLRSRFAAWLFALSLCAIVANNLMTSPRKRRCARRLRLAKPDDRDHHRRDPAIAYAWTTTKRGVLS
jgi:hypothetical protein